MGNFLVKEPPEYDDKMRMLETTDLGHANVFNPLFEKLLNNEAFLKVVTDAARKHMQDGEIHVTTQDKQGWNAKAETAAATQDAAGLMSAGDKKKLDGVAVGAEVNQNAYSNVKVGNIIITANGKTAIFTLEAGSNITLSADNAAKKIIITANRDGGNADTVDGYHAAHFAIADHGHDGRYYTKAESDNQLKTKAAASHSHTKASISDFPTSMPPTAHTHDDQYYTETEVNNLLAGKAASSHSHSGYAAKSIYGDSEVSYGRKAGTIIGAKSFAFGYNVEASAQNSHAEGRDTTASGNYSHVEGYSGTASGHSSHAEGYHATASGDSSHATGTYTVANGKDQTVVGRHNKPDTKMNEINNLFEVGCGLDSNNLSNAFRITYSGDAYIKTAYHTGGADYAEFFEWLDKNLYSEDRIGYFVTLNNDKIRIANAEDTYILGIVSAAPSVVGNSPEDWAGRWKKDKLGRLIKEISKIPITTYEKYEEAIFDEDGQETGNYKQKTREIRTDEYMELEHPVAVDEYDSSMAYISRANRPEWAAIGMLGVLAVYDDRSCQVNGFCKVADGGIATAADGEYKLSEGKTIKGYRVIERVADNIIKVIFR